MVSIGFLSEIRVRQAEDVLFQDLDGELVLLSTRTGEYYGLNDVGTRIWILLQEGWELPAIVKSLQARYEVRIDQLLTDVRKFLTDLEASGLITVERA